MSEVATILEQARLFVVQHAPAEALKGAIPAGIVFLIGGVLLSVLGAKLARFGITTAFVVVGGVTGIGFAKETTFSPLICVLAGALLIGIIGFQTYRLWVGLLAATVLSSFVMGAFGYRQLVPHVAAFEQVTGLSASGESSAFSVPTPQEQRAYRDRSPQQWAAEFWDFVGRKDVSVTRNGKALAAVTMLGGLCLGLLAVRWAMILATSLLGTSLVTTGMATLLTQSVPDSYQAFQNNPSLVGIGVGGFLVTSLVLQTMLSRKPTSEKGGSKSS